MTEGKRGKVISLFDELAKRGKSPQEARKPAKTVRIDGNQSLGLIGNGNQVTIYVSTEKPARPPLVIDPGGKHISSTQAGVLANIVRNLHAMNIHAQRVWGAFNRRYALASYRELPSSRFEDAEAYLREWLEKERLTQGNAAADERVRLIKTIYAQRRKRGMDEAALKQLVGGVSLSRLAVADLRRILANILAVPPTTR